MSQPHSDDRDHRLAQLAVELRQVDPAADYYQLSLTGTRDGVIHWSAYTHFVDFTDETCRFEIRAASLIKPEFFVDLWTPTKTPYLVVNTDQHLFVYLNVGGYALVRREIAETRLADVLAPSASARTGPAGFKGLSAVPPAELQHAPSKKQRMRIIKRDGYRCKICGERPADNVHVTLHVHHVRMWTRGGLTEDENLITICHTCHGGLDPHEDFSLFGLMNTGGGFLNLERRNAEFRDGVEQYRRIVAKIRERESVAAQARTRKPRRAAT